MNWRCFFTGCKWSPFLEHYSGGELLKVHICKRCGTHRTVNGEE